MKFKSYNKEEKDSVIKYISESLGDIAYMIYGDENKYGPQLDLAIVIPKYSDDTFKIVTVGFGAFEMKNPISDEYQAERAELLITLPKEWKLSKEENDIWPFKWLNYIASMTSMENGWLGFGHSYSTEDIKTIPGTGFKTIALSNTVDADYNFMEFELSNEKKIYFYELIPLYQEELLYKQENGMLELLELFKTETFPFVVNVNRKNYCKDIVKEMNKKRGNERFN